MIAVADLRRAAREYLRAAKLLRTRGSYDAAAYLCGYAVEIALKARICRTLRWAGFPDTGAEFKNKASLKTHDLETLLDFTAMQDRIKTAYFTSWSVVNQWNPEQRYNPVGTQAAAAVDGMIMATQNF